MVKNSLTVRKTVPAYARLSAFRVRREARLELAAKAVKDGETYQTAATTYHLSASTVWLFVNVREHRRVGRPASLTERQEDLIVKTLVLLAVNGLPGNNDNLREAVRVLLAQMTPVLRHVIQLKEYKVTPKFLRAFRHRHSSELRFARPLRQEAARFRPVNGEAMTQHFQTLEQIIREENLTPECIFNLDECGVTPDKDFQNSTRRRCLMPRRGRSGTTDQRLAEWSYYHRVTMMPVINAAGAFGPTLFVFRGNRLPYRVVMRDGEQVTESPVVCLPRGSVVAHRERLGGVDTSNFLSWGWSFVRYVAPLTALRRKVLLIFDAYRAHISLPVLQLFKRNGIIAYALPSHTSGKTQPLDVVAFSSFKNALKNAASESVALHNNLPLDQFAFAALIKAAFQASFTMRNIQSSFRRAGIYPFDPSRIIGNSMRRTADDESTVMTPEELLELLKKRREQAREGIYGPPVHVLACGYIDTKLGSVMNSDEAMFMAENKALEDQQRALHKQDNAAKKAVRAAKAAEKRTEHATRVSDSQLARRARLDGENVEQFKKHLRPMKERIAIAKTIVLRKRMAALGMTSN